MSEQTPKILLLDSIDSTNSYLNELLRQFQKDSSAYNKCRLSNGFCVCADYQTAGRGQVNNTWESSSKENLLFSVLLQTEHFPLESQFLLSEVVSIAIAKVLSNNGIEVKIKYPNDIFFGDKKIAGILIENQIVGSVMRYSIVGIGLNVNQIAFSQNRFTAISMCNITGKNYDRYVLLQEIVKQIVAYTSNFHIADKEYWKRLYFSRLYRAEGFHRYEANGIEFNARITDIADNGRLYLITDTGEKRQYYFKEVRFII